jgi:hypothetical protein
VKRDVAVIDRPSVVRHLSEHLEFLRPGWFATPECKKNKQRQDHEDWRETGLSMWHGNVFL